MKITAEMGYIQTSRAILELLLKEEADNQTYLADYINTLVKTGHCKEALALYPDIDLKQAPEFIYDALLTCARKKRRTEMTSSLLKYYQQHFKKPLPADSLSLPPNSAVINTFKSPDKLERLIQQARKELAKNSTDNNISIIEQELMPYYLKGNKHPDLLKIMLTWFDRKKNYHQTAYIYQQLLKQEKSPRDRRSYKRQLVLDLFYAGAPVRALEILDDDTTLLIEHELNKLMVDYYAYRLRWNRYSFTRDTQAHKDLQQLLSEMNKKLEQLQTSTDQYNRIRLHQDYIVALKKNNQPHEVIRQYRLLKQREQLNIENISDYVLLNVASAWLDIKEPDEAVKLYRYLLDKNPDNFRIKQALSYALMDINEPEQAIELVEKLNNSTPLWRKDHSGEVSRFNPEKQEAQIQLATILAFADQLEQA